MSGEQDPLSHCYLEICVEGPEVNSAINREWHFLAMSTISICGRMQLLGGRDLKVDVKKKRGREVDFVL